LSELPRITGLVRSENDTWDITTSVGVTALFVAAARALEASKADPLVVDPYAEIFCRAVGGEWADVLDGKGPADNRLMREFGAYFIDFQAARTKFFDTYFYDACDAGVRQVVIPAAGLDSRAYRLAWPSGTVVFEIDQPRVLDFKREVLAGSGDAPTAERREIAVDLRDDWPHALLRSGFDPMAPSAWLVEGLLIYLPSAAQQHLFAGIDALSAPASHVAIEESVPMDEEQLELARAEERAARTQDRFFTLIYNEQLAPAGEWFGNRGWQAATVSLTDYFREIGRPVPEPNSEAGAMFAHLSLVSAVKG
jgi:methyltransferase (TIGR00027 family)